MTHRFACRVYYEDTDMAGIVYYANYLKFIERARSDWVRGLGIDQGALRAGGHVFAVRRVLAEYLAPARFDDLLEVRTEQRRVTGARIGLWQEVWRGDWCLFTAAVDLVFLTLEGRPARIPAEFRRG